jgi:hypothetical protein
MKYAAELASGIMIKTPCFITIGSGIQKFVEGGVDTKTQTTRWSHKPNFILSQ